MNRHPNKDKRAPFFSIYPREHSTWWVFTIPCFFKSTQISFTLFFSTTKETNKVITTHELFLLDSGAQYKYKINFL